LQAPRWAQSRTRMVLHGDCPGLHDASLAQQALSSILQSADQAVSTARRDDRGKLVPSHREIADGPVEIDIDHPSFADQVVYLDGPPPRLQQPGLDDFSAAARYRTCLRIDDEAFPRIVVYLARIVGDDESRKGLVNCRLLCRREALPGRADRQPRHGRKV